MLTKHKCNQGAKHRWYDVIVAWASGEQIQFIKDCDSEWKDYTYANDSTQFVPAFGDRYIEWRIKPKTVTKKYRMALVADDDEKVVIALDLADYSLDFPAEREVHGFIRWVGDTVEVEIEV